jgi:hypothetical protein
MSKTTINKKLFIILSIFTLLLTGSMGFGATYYVDATNGNDSSNGISPYYAWRTIEKVNASKFYAGDYILFKRGEIWREQLIVSSSGTSQSPIVFGSYGQGKDPILNGTNLATDWRNEGDNKWSTMLKKEPTQIFFNKSRGIEQSSIQDLDNENEWFWSNSKLFIYTELHPSTTYTPSGVEVDRDTSCIEISNVDSVIIQNLHAYAGRHGFYVSNNSNNIIIDGVHASYNYRRGIFIYQWVESKNSCDTGIIKNSETEWQGGIGISIVGRVSNWVVKNNEVHHTCSLDKDTFWHYQTAGINAFGVDVTNLIVEDNHCYRNGVNVTGPRGAGIWMDTVGRGLIVRRNDIHENYLIGILIEVTSRAKIAYNLSYKNSGNVACSGIAVIGRDDFPANGNEIYNNVAYGNNPYGIRIEAKGKIKNTISNNLIINNISVGNGSRNLIAINGGENNGTTGGGNVYKYNCFGKESRGFIMWGINATISTYDDWESIYEASFSVKADPYFNNPITNNFTLKSNSPCIDAGTDVFLIKDYSGNRLSGNNWDIGAYEYQIISPPKNLKTSIQTDRY